MKLADIPLGSDIAYRSAAKIVVEQVEFELETCRRLLGTEPEKVLELLANTPDWSVFLDDEDLYVSPANPSHSISLPAFPRGE